MQVLGVWTDRVRGDIRGTEYRRTKLTSLLSPSRLVILFVGLGDEPFLKRNRFSFISKLGKPSRPGRLKSHASVLIDALVVEFEQ